MSQSRSAASRFRILVPILLLAFAGCAYYNTFYLARRYYKDAQKEQERSVAETISPGAATKYEQTIRQCTKVITEYPKSKWVDDATYLLGASLYGKGDYVNAIRRFEELEEKFPKSPFVPEARLVKGLAHYRRRDYPIADSILVALDRAYPELPRRWELYFYAGESRVAQDDYTGGLWWYRRAVEAADGRRQKADALRRTGDALYEADRLDSAQAVYAQTLKEEERPKQRLDIIIRRAETLRDLKRYDQALDLLNEWRGTAADEQREGELLLRVYELQGLLGKHDVALKGYQDLVERYPNTNVAHESQFQVGYLYETARGDLDQAAREYEKLRQVGGTNTFAQQAARRSQSLTSLKQFRQQLDADTTGARARTAFRLAEVYYFELGKADSAELRYRAVEALYPTSVYAPKSAYARLWITAYDHKDTLGAMRLTDSIAERYRGTRYAESALYLWKQWSRRTDERTALLDSLLANPDTSGTVRFADEAEADSLSAAPRDSVPAAASAPDSGYQVPPEVMERLRANAEAARLRAAQNRKSGGASPAPGSTPQPAPADTTRSTTPPRLPAPSDTTRGTAPPDTARTAPPDTTRSAPSDTSGTTR